MKLTFLLIILAQQWAKTLKIDKAKVIQFKGFQKVNEFEIGGEDAEPIKAEPTKAE